MQHALICIIGTYFWKKTRPCDVACWNKWCCPLWRNRNCWQTVQVEIIIAERLPALHIVISHPITRTDSKHLAMKIGDTKSHLCQLQIDIIENENISSNHLKSRGLHLNGKGVLQFAKYLIESIRKLWYEKELVHQKKVSSELWDHNSQISPKNLSHNNTFIQPSVSSINSFKRNYKKNWEIRKITYLNYVILSGSQILYQKLHA